MYQIFVVITAMNDRKEQTIAEAVQAWEFGLLKFIYDKSIITVEEYLGIRRIAEMQYQLEKVCPK